MKEKTKIMGYILLILLLSYTIVMVGCGKSPLSAVLSGSTVGAGNMTVEVMKF